MTAVTVIVPVYNGEKYLRECADSIVGQSFKDLEIIFVDDGSTDSSLKILEEYADGDTRVRIIKGAHAGGGSARNLGIENAGGEYLMFFDSDDIMSERLIEKLYNKCKKTNADVGVFSVRFWHEATGAVTDEVCGLREENLPEKDVFSVRDMPQHIFNTFHNWPWNKMFRREFVEKNGIRFQEIMRTNDLLFTCKSLVLAERITCVREYLATYRVRLTDSCQASNSKAPLDFYKAFSALKKFLEEQGVYGELKQSFVNHAVDGCIANLNTADFNPSHKLIFNALKDEILDSLDISGHGDEYFYPQNVENKVLERLRHVENDSYEEYLLYRANELNDLFHERLYLGYHDWQRILGFEREIEQLKGELESRDRQLNKIRSTPVYRLGRLVASPVRKAKNKINSIRK